MLAGRKLLLADDSPTIQKVVELTFADEGVAVVTLGSGTEALARLGEVKPDVVLADVCMPPPNGYEICEYIKQNAELRHIPVMLLVGSFEPFDEAEARRVGADEILTKPFESIRRLIDKVGGLVSGKQNPDLVPTAELPQVEEAPDESIHMSTEELEITTANTQPLPDSPVDQSVQIAHDPAPITREAKATIGTEREMETNTNLQIEATDNGDVLLDLGDLGDIAPARVSQGDDFVLDIDLDETPQPAFVKAAAVSHTHAFVEPEISAPAAVDWQMGSEPNGMPSARDTGELDASAAARMHDTQEWMREFPTSSASNMEEVDSAEAGPVKLERIWDEPEERQQTHAAASDLSANQLSPEVIDAIARRAVEQLSERVVQQIAWEVVPQLAELMIKRKLEEKESQTK